MKKIIYYLIIVFLVIVTIKTCERDKTNNKGYWFNFGQSSKEVVKSTIQWVKPTYESIKEGFESE